MLYEQSLLQGRRQHAGCRPAAAPTLHSDREVRPAERRPRPGADAPRRTAGPPRLRASIRTRPEHSECRPRRGADPPCRIPPPPRHRGQSWPRPGADAPVSNVAEGGRDQRMLIAGSARRPGSVRLCEWPPPPGASFCVRRRASTCEWPARPRCRDDDSMWCGAPHHRSRRACRASRRPDCARGTGRRPAPLLLPRSRVGSRPSSTSLHEQRFSCVRGRRPTDTSFSRGHHRTPETDPLCQSGLTSNGLRRGRSSFGTRRGFGTGRGYYASIA